jgi:hypothetical protein
MNDLIKSLEAIDPTNHIEPNNHDQQCDIQRTSKGLVKLSGKLTNFKSTHGEANFFLGQSNSNSLRSNCQCL